MGSAEYDFWICVICIGSAAIVGFLADTVSQNTDERRTRKILGKREGR